MYSWICNWCHNKDNNNQDDQKKTQKDDKNKDIHDKDNHNKVNHKKDLQKKSGKSLDFLWHCYYQHTPRGRVVSRMQDIFLFVIFFKFLIKMFHSKYPPFYNSLSLWAILIKKYISTKLTSLQKHVG